MTRKHIFLINLSALALLLIFSPKYKNSDLKEAKREPALSKTQAKLPHKNNSSTISKLNELNKILKEENIKLIKTVLENMSNKHALVSSSARHTYKKLLKNSNSKTSDMLIKEGLKYYRSQSESLKKDLAFTLAKLYVAQNNKMAIDFINEFLESKSTPLNEKTTIIEYIAQSNSSVLYSSSLQTLRAYVNSEQSIYFRDNASQNLSKSNSELLATVYDSNMYINELKYIEGILRAIESN